MAKQKIEIGTGPNVGDADTLFQAFTKVNANFDEVYSKKEDSLPEGDVDEFLNGNRDFVAITIAAVSELPEALDDRALKGGITSSGLTSAGSRLVGRKDSTTGALQSLDSLEVKTLLGLENVSNTSDALKPLSNAANTALAAKQDSLLPGTNSQFLRGDKTFVAITKSDVGLNAVDNTSDSAKPVFQATTNGIVPAPGATAFAAGNKYLASDGSWKTITSTSGGVTSVNTRTGDIVLTKSDVGLDKVDNTSDTQKPVSTPQQTALNGKADATHTHGIADVSGLQSALNGKEPTLAAASSNPATKFYRGDKTWQDLDKGAVGLLNVDNTSDTDKPVSTATQAALDLKANITSLVRSVKFFFRAPTDMVPTKPVVDVASATTTVVIAKSGAKALTANTVQVVFNILKNGTNIGTVTFAANATAGVIAIPQSADLVFAMGDFIEVVAPATGVDDLAGMTVVLRN